MFLKKTNLKMNPSTLRVEGTDSIYTTFSGTQSVRLVAFFKDKKTDEKKVLYADILTPGGKHTMLRSTFENEFAEIQYGAPPLRVISVEEMLAELIEGVLPVTEEVLA